MSKEKKVSEKLAELDALVAWFEQDDLDIDDAIQKFEQVATLATEIKADLAVVGNKITILEEKFNVDKTV